MSNIDVRHDTGYGIVSEKIMRNKDISIGAKMVYSYLAVFPENASRMLSNIKMLGQELDISEKDLHGYLGELVNIGYLEEN